MSSDQPLEQRLHALETRLQRLEATAAIERLQRSYGYYLDQRMWSEIVALFSDDGEVEIGRRGIYRGRQQLQTFFVDVLGRGRSGRTKKELHNHIQIQGIVTLETPERALGRFRALAQFAQELPDGTPGCGWAEGIYENVYTCSAGTWRIRSLRWTPSFYGQLPAEAIAAGRPSARPSEQFPPDAASSFGRDETGSWAAPFHYPHPITGKPTPID
jgi:hypothetical protein